jgi:hypothetical protein
MTTELIAAYEERLANIRQLGVFGELLYVAVLDGAGVDLVEARRRWRQDDYETQVFCERCKGVRPHREITGGEEDGVVFCCGCGWGYYHGRHFNRTHLTPRRLKRRSLTKENVDAG